MEQIPQNIIFANDLYVAGFSIMEYAKPHRHEMIQVFLFFPEPGRVQIGTQKVSASCIYIPSNVDHSYIGNSNACFSILIDPLCELSQYLERFDYCIELSCPNRMQDIFYNAMSELSSDSFCMLFHEFFEQIQYHETGECLFHAHVQNAINIIRKEAANDLTVTALSQMLNLSESRLSHLFKEQTGITLKKYILLCKWKTSYLQMLIHKNVTVAAMIGGFSAPSHFSKVNRELTGITAKHMHSHSTLIEK